jgi:energy-coupling factor transporter ATP-binding protein EcfA2
METDLTFIQQFTLFLIAFGLLCIIGVAIKIPTWLERRRSKVASRRTAPLAVVASRSAAMASNSATLPYEIEPEPPQIAPKYRQVYGFEIKPWRESMRERLALREERAVQARAVQARAVQERSARIEAILRNAQLPEISYAELVQGSDRNILIVGPKGSGKTTLLNRLIALRAGYVEAFDPHNEPGKWPCPVVGGGERFEGILRHLTAVYELMKERYQQSNAGTRSQAGYQQPEWAITLVGDEWGGIVAELPSKGKTQLGAGAIQAKLLARGRKVGIGLLVAAHDDTAAQVGLEGEMGLLGCYDYIVYLGAQATSNSSIPKEVREEARAMQRPAVVLSTERQAWLRFPAIAHEPLAFDDHDWQRPADYAAILDVQARSGVQTEQGAFMNGNGRVHEILNARSGHPDAEVAQRSNGVQRSRSDVQMLEEALKTPLFDAAERLNVNTDEERAASESQIQNAPITPEELAKLGQAILLYAQNGGKKGEAICAAFGVKRGGTVAYRRAAWLVGQALRESEEKSEAQPNES